MVLVVVVVSSSRPSSPCTTSTLDWRAAKTPAITSASSANAQPISPARGRPGLVSGPSKLKTVAHRSRAAPPTRADMRDGTAARSRTRSRPRQRCARRRRAQVDAHAERFQRVGPAGQRRRRPVSVLDHRNAAGRNHYRRHRRQVEGADPVATGTDHVDGVGPDLLGRQPAAVLAASRRPARPLPLRSAPSSSSPRRRPRAAPASPIRS